MPTKEARKCMVKKLLSDHIHNLQEEDFDECSDLTPGFSGADVKLLCKEAAMTPVRYIFKKMDDIKVTNDVTSNYPSRLHKKGPMNVQKLLGENPISLSHFRSSLECTKPSTSSTYLERYEDWANSYGSV